MAEPTLEVVESDALGADVREEILALCNAAYGEDLTALFATHGSATHVLARVAGELASHAMWVTRRLRPGAGPERRTAYVEMVATRPARQRRGLATLVMERLVAAIPAAYEMAALCPATPVLYERLGWRFWRGPLAIRLPSGELQATPEERVMVLPLPGRPSLDLDDPLSAEWRAGELW